MLFGGLDYASVTHRVAFGSGPNLRLTPEERAALGEPLAGTAESSAAVGGGRGGDAQGQHAREQAPGSVEQGGHVATAPTAAAEAAPQDGAGLGRELGNFVEWVLARDPTKRPGWTEVRARLQQLRAHALAQCGTA